MPATEIIKVNCPQCGGERNAAIVASHCDDWGNHMISGTTDYRVLKCCGCDFIFFQKDAINSEDLDYSYHPVTGETECEAIHTIHYWPALTKRRKPDWHLSNYDYQLGALFEDVYTALDNELSVLAAIGIRTVFDRASELLHIDPAITFKEKLDALLSQGKIGKDEQDALNVLIDAGSAAAHRGWKPTLKQLDTMMSIVESFLYRNFILGESTKTLKSHIPAKPKRNTPKK